MPPPPFSHFHAWKLVNYTGKALFSCISTKKLSFYFYICAYYTFLSCSLNLMSSPCTCESATKIKKLLSRHRLLLTFIFYHSILLLLSQLGKLSNYTQAGSHSKPSRRLWPHLLLYNAEQFNAALKSRFPKCLLNYFHNSKVTVL